MELTHNRIGNNEWIENITRPHMKARSLLEIFLVSGLPADAVSSMSSSALNPTRATPFRTPTVAGMAPFIRTTDSRCDAKATFSGYGKPAH